MPLSIAAMQAMVDGGVDIVEVGVPYSDPVMDGPTIQAAVDPAVRAGVGIADALRRGAGAGRAGGAAVVMSYWNPIERYGVERFAADLAAAGGSGAITPDLIPDEAGAVAGGHRRARPRPDLPGRAVVDRCPHRVDRGASAAASSTPRRRWA